MKIKVHCPCEARYEFEIEPVNGRMPMPVNCPVCGHDGTALANELIQQQLAAKPEAQPRLRVSAAPARASVAPPPPPSASAMSPLAPPASAPALRVARQTTAATASSAPVDAARFCYKHYTEPAAETCRVCHKPICLKCMEMFGYVCSVYCREHADRRGLDVPVYAHQRTVVHKKSSAKSRRVVFAIVAAAMGLVGVWVWYSFFGSTPHVVYSLKIPKSERGTFYHLLAPNQLLSMNGKQLALFDVSQQKQLWSTPFEIKSSGDTTPFGALAKQVQALKAGAQTTSRPPAVQKTNSPPAATASAQNDQAAQSDDDDEDFSDYLFFEKPRVIASGDDLWLLFPHQLARFDRHSGARKEDVDLDEPIENISQTDAAILVVSRGERGNGKVLTRIALPSGTVAKEKIGSTLIPAGSALDAKSPWTAQSKSKTSPSATVADSEDEASDDNPFWARSGDEFIMSDPTVVQFKHKLLEKRVNRRQAMKPKGKSIMDGKITAGSGLDAAQEMINDSQREATGGFVEEDVSRYEVTLKRSLAKNASDWIGEVIGSPNFFPLKTVDILTAGQSVYVFNKNNQKMWEAKMTYPVSGRFSFSLRDEEHAPGLEVGNVLYVFDQGTLARFDLATGNVKWRVNSVGISKIQLDSRGQLYVNTTTASPDSIQYSQQVNIYERVQPQIMKVDAESGKVLWKRPRLADELILSGKYIYAGRSSFGSVFAGDSNAHFNLYRVNPSSGKELWHHYVPRFPMKMDIQQNWIMLHFRDEVQVLKYLSF